MPLIIHLTGMTYRNYLHLSGVLEVKCSGKYLPPGVEVSFIKIFKLIDKKIVVIALPLKNTCETYQYYSSCDVKVRDTRLSTVKTLITELKGGETTDLGCSVNTFNRLGDTHTYTWTLAIMREREICIMFLKVIMFVCLWMASIIQTTSHVLYLY